MSFKVVDEWVASVVAAPFCDACEPSSGGAGSSDVGDVVAICPGCSLPRRLDYPLDDFDGGTSVCPNIQRWSASFMMQRDLGGSDPDFRDSR
jgi:hypothetical protein